MAYALGGERTNLVTGYTKGDDGHFLYGWQNYLAQTFRLFDLTCIYAARAKLYVSTTPRDQYWSIHATDIDGKPTGPPLFQKLGWATFGMMDKPITWRRATFDNFPILSAGTYALVLSAPSFWAWDGYSWRMDSSSPTYQHGNSWRSTDFGATWLEIPDTDFMFEIWGYTPPPTPPPTPAISNWAPVNYAISDTPTGVKIVVTTDIPVHLFMRWTTVKPLTHKTTLIRRGISLPNATRFCFVSFHENEQLESGDTYIHTFVKEPWAICETRYFYFIGTKQGEESPSASPIFKHHRTTAPVTCFYNG